MNIRDIEGAVNQCINQLINVSPTQFSGGVFSKCIYTRWKKLPRGEF